MNANTSKLLRAVDDADGFEVPHQDWSSFPYRDIAASVATIQEVLVARTGIPFTRDGQVQDASFHDELRVLAPQSYMPNGVLAIIPEIAIRFSNFGRLFTVYSHTGNSLEAYPLTDILAIVEGHGWTYVPVEELDEPYDGANQALRDEEFTWWTRFFDYL